MRETMMHFAVSTNTHVLYSEMTCASVMLQYTPVHTRATLGDRISAKQDLTRTALAKQEKKGAAAPLRQLPRQQTVGGLQQSNC